MEKVRTIELHAHCMTILTPIRRCDCDFQRRQSNAMFMSKNRCGPSLLGYSSDSGTPSNGFRRATYPRNRLPARVGLDWGNTTPCGISCANNSQTRWLSESVHASCCLLPRDRRDVALTASIHSETPALAPHRTKSSRFSTETSSCYNENGPILTVLARIASAIPCPRPLLTPSFCPSPG